MIKTIGMLGSAAFLAATSLVAWAGTAQPSSSGNGDVLGIMECVKPEINSYWKGETSQTADEFVVIYSIQGLWADVEGRFPSEVVQAIHDASAQALAKDNLTLAARDMDQVSNDFYAALQADLTHIAKLPEGACGIQVQRLIAVFKKRYHFSLLGAEMDPWYLDNHINELNVKNDQFLALFSKGSLIKGSCKIVWDNSSKRVEVCE